MPPGAEREVVIFDFDGTLVGRDSVLDFCFRYALARPWRLLLVALVAPVAGCAGLRSTRRAASVLLWALTCGTSTPRFVRALRRYGARILPRFVHPRLLQELRSHLEQGAHVVLATGSLPTLVRAFLRAHGLPALPVAGSRLVRRRGGLVVVTHCVGKTKLRELERRFGIRSWSRVYTDSWADAPLMSQARDVTLVAPSPRTEMRAQSLLQGRAPLRTVPAG
jgi:phosphatidylglycerophosphatase C